MTILSIDECKLVKHVLGNIRIQLECAFTPLLAAVNTVINYLFRAIISRRLNIIAYVCVAFPSICHS